METIHKSAWLYVQDRQVLFARSKNQPDTFYLPGGKREAGETDQEALLREVAEETTVQLKPESITQVAEFSDHAHGKPAHVQVHVTAYIADYNGELQADEEIAELAWLTSADTDKLYGVGRQAVAWLQEQDLID